VIALAPFCCWYGRARSNGLISPNGPARQAGVRQTSRVPLPEPLPTTYSVVLDGGRVRQREVGPADLDDAWAWSSDERFFRYLPVKRHATREAERVWLESVIAEATLSPRRQYELGIELAETASLVGMARIDVDSERHRSANIGYGVAPGVLESWHRVGGGGTDHRLRLRSPRHAPYLGDPPPGQRGLSARARQARLPCEGPTT
jgi:RimJ/RimL family protein N-acetyltransferase